ncbi:MAG TPA: hypothetical protein VLC93_11705, partial [Myxococcota bacterium]|nr:hypothetical protein [Myxococcota bacterium]
MQRGVVIALALAAVAACGRTELAKLDVPPEETPADDNLWVELGDSATAGGISAHGGGASCIAVIVDTLGRVYVAWADDHAGSGQIYVRRFDGAWSSLQGSGDGGGISRGTAVVGGSTCPGGIDVDAADRVYVSWHQFNGIKQSVHLRVWDDASWSELGASATGDGISNGLVTNSWWPSVIVDESGTPWVSYTSASDAYVERWTTSWAGVDGSDTAPGMTGVSNTAALIHVARAPGGGGVAAAWTEQNGSLHVATSDGANWTALAGTVGTSASSSSRPMIHSRGNALVVAWADADDPVGRTQVARYEAGSWQRLPAATTAGGQQAAMALDTQGNPVIVWSNPGGATRQIRGVRWNGLAWSSIDGPSGN